MCLNFSQYVLRLVLGRLQLDFFTICMVHALCLEYYTQVQINFFLRKRYRLLYNCDSFFSFFWCNTIMIPGEDWSRKPEEFRPCGAQRVAATLRVAATVEFWSCGAQRSIATLRAASTGVFQSWRAESAVSASGVGEMRGWAEEQGIGEAWMRRRPRVSGVRAGWRNWRHREREK